MKTLEDRAQAFEALAAPLERQVYFTCLRMMGNREDAEDCAQESMLKAFRSFASFRGDSQFSTWLYAITTRTCLDALRKRRDVVSLEALKEEGFEAQSAEPEAYEQLEAGERKRLLEEALTQLPEEQRAVLVLCDLQQLPQEEAAKVLSCPLGTVKSRLHRARGALRHLLQKQMELFRNTDRPNDERRETP